MAEMGTYFFYLEKGASYHMVSYYYKVQYCTLLLETTIIFSNMLLSHALRIIKYGYIID